MNFVDRVSYVTCAAHLYKAQCGGSAFRPKTEGALLAMKAVCSGDASDVIAVQCRSGCRVSNCYHLSPYQNKPWIRGLVDIMI